MPFPAEAAKLLVVGLKKVATPCGVGDCRAHSLGAVCIGCGRSVCLRHGYATLALPPRPICVSCIVDDHPDLFVEGSKT